MTFECYYCHKQYTDVIQFLHDTVSGYENLSVCFKCLYEKGKYESLKPEENWKTEYDKK
jgi:hypothetical protein